MNEIDPLSVYLDTCIISGLAKEDLRKEEYMALKEILVLRKTGKVQLVTSPIAKAELEKIPEALRIKHEVIYNLLSDVPIKRFRSITGLSPIGVPGFGYGRLNRDYLRLRQLLTDEEDAKHLYQAIRNGIQVFLTTDFRTILRKRAIVEKSFSIKLRSPTEFIREWDTRTRNRDSG